MGKAEMTHAATMSDDTGRLPPSVVAKTAALCVAKLYDLKPELVLENGFLEQLHDMISDSNPTVR